MNTAWQYLCGLNEKRIITPGKAGVLDSAQVTVRILQYRLI